MKSKLKISISLIITLLCMTGCMSHTFIFNFTNAPVVKYEVEGDEPDVYDDRIKLPDSLEWNFIEKTEKISSDSSKSIKLIYESTFNKVLTHPLTPPEKKGVFQVKSGSNIFMRYSYLHATFPSWQVEEYYGYYEAFLPEEAHILDEEESASMLSEEERERLEALKLEAMEKGAANRYLKHLKTMVEKWYEENESVLDSVVLKDAFQRFSSVLQVKLMTLRNVDPDNVTLEWYDQMRMPMATSASEACGGSLEWFLNESDKLDQRYKAWLDLGDDVINIQVIIPEKYVNAVADSVSGDTLFWELSPEYLADKDFVIDVRAYTPRASGWIIVSIPIVALLVFLLRRKKE